MKLIRSLLVPAAVFLLASVIASAQTTTLTFAGATGADVRGGYGDRVAGPTSGGFQHVGTGSFTPNVLVDIGAKEGALLLEPHTWPTGYSDLLDVLYVSPSGLANLGAELQVTLTADPGYQVQLQWFDLGNYGGALTLPYLRVTDESGALLHEELNVGVPVYSQPARRVTFPQVLMGRILTLRISLAGTGGAADHLGLDNLTFGQWTAPTIEVGSSYCAASTNTSGGPAAVRAWGSAVAAHNDVRLVATGLPFGSVGFFMASRTQGFVANPAGSLGNLCLGGAIGRFIGPGQVRAAGTTGSFALRVELTAMPTPTGPVAALAGEAWNFQAWYRDSVFGAAASNFTAGLAVVWQ